MRRCLRSGPTSAPRARCIECSPPPTKCGERRDQVRHPAYGKPELVATAPNQVWSWDITKLKGPVPYLYDSLYVILDLFSRYVVGWMVAVKESAHLAERLIEQTCAKQRIQPQQLTIHADRGAPMRSKLVAHVVLRPRASRPATRGRSVSNDNPFAEAQFRTFKYRPAFPKLVRAHSNTRAPSATTSWLGTMTPTTTAASAISRRPSVSLRPRAGDPRPASPHPPRGLRRASGAIRQRSTTPRNLADRRVDQSAVENHPPGCGQDRRPAPRTTRCMRVVARPRPPLDRSSLHRVDGVESLP